TCFAAWRDVSGLLALLSDPSFGIRKSAMYHLGTMSPSAEVAEAAWLHLRRPDALGVHASETLNTFVHHAPRETAVPRLVSIAADPARTEHLRMVALEALVKHEAVEEVGAFLPLLQQPPLVTRSMHVVLLAA